MRAIQLSSLKIRTISNSFLDYCDAWKLQINFSKTKIIVFVARNIAYFCFYTGTTKIEIIKQYKYLGVIFSSSGSLLNARKHIGEQAMKAM